MRSCDLAMEMKRMKTLISSHLTKSLDNPGAGKIAVGGDASGGGAGTGARAGGAIRDLRDPLYLSSAQDSSLKLIQGSRLFVSRAIATAAGAAAGGGRGTTMAQSQATPIPGVGTNSVADRFVVR